MKRYQLSVRSQTEHGLGYWVRYEDVAKYQAVVDAAQAVWDGIEARADRTAIQSGLGVSEWKAFCTGIELQLKAKLDALDEEGK